MLLNFAFKDANWSKKFIDILTDLFYFKHRIYQLYYQLKRWILSNNG